MILKRTLLFLFAFLIFHNLRAQQNSGTNNTSISSNDVILLISPFDKDTIEELNPVFNWTLSNLNPVQVGDGLPMQVYFKYTLVKINSDQNKISAIQQNQPIYTVSPLQGNILQYPFNAPILERGNKYAWKIDKFLNGALYNQSEIWEFYIKKEVIKNALYELKSVDEYITVTPVNHSFNILFFEKFQTTPLNLKLKNTKGVTIEGYSVENISKNNKIVSNNKEIGKNTFLITLDDALPRGIYIMEVLINKNEVYRLKVYND